MLNEPPEKTIESITHVLLMCESKAVMRAYAGREQGQGRRLAVCEEIAKRIAPRYTFPIEVRDGDRVVTEKELIDLLAGVLRSIPDEQAFLMVSKDARHRNSIALMISRRMAKRLKAKFEMRQIDNTATMLRVSEPDRKSYGDEALDNLTRLGCLVPRYRWKRTSDIHTPDFTGYEGGLPIARVWYDYSKGPEEWWQWECIATLDRRLNSPPAGGADITRQAARDVEDYYDALKRLNGLMETTA